MKRYCLTNYTVQCVDVTTGLKGCFLFDAKHWQDTGEFKAIGEVFPDLQSFYSGTKAEDRKPCYLEREADK